MTQRNFISIVWLWMLTLLTASVGVSVQQIYCYCAGKTTYAVFETPLECVVEKAKLPDHCCQPARDHQKKSCCDKTSDRQKNDGCTQKSSRYFQLKTEYTLGAKSFELTKAPCLLQDMLAPEYPALEFATDTPGKGFESFAEAPPPLPGRIICLQHGVFRC